VVVEEEQEVLVEVEVELMVVHLQMLVVGRGVLDTILDKLVVLNHQMERTLLVEVQHLVEMVDLILVVEEGQVGTMVIHSVAVLVVPAS
jgi:hypothetical protein